MDPSSFIDTTIRSICIPSSVTCLSGGRWDLFPDSLELLTFEPGSQLRRIESPLFSDAPVHVCLPASLEYVDGSAFYCALSDRHCARLYTVEHGNPHFVVVGSALMNIEKTSLVCYLGRESVPTLDSMVEELGRYSFAGNAITTFTFPENSRVRFIRSRAFSECLLLDSITIPFTVEVIENGGFSGCEKLREVRIESGSRLRRIERTAFLSALALEPFDVPFWARIEGRYNVLQRVRHADGSLWRTVRIDVEAL
jgi:hypothetical protein